MTQQVVLARFELPVIDPSTDNASFQLHFEATGSDTSIDFSELDEACQDFIQDTPPGGSHIPGAYLSTEVDRSTNAGTVTYYDITGHLDGSPAGAPIHMATFTVPAAIETDSGNLPAGIAAVVSYRADYGSDVEFGTHIRPRARDRNRFYFGPLSNTLRAQDSTTHRPKLASVFVADMLLALKALSTLREGFPNQMQLVVWSRAAAAVKLANTAWMDDRFDYQRRRSDPTPATRTFQSLT